MTFLALGPSRIVSRRRKSLVVVARCGMRAQDDSPDFAFRLNLVTDRQIGIPVLR